MQILSTEFSEHSKQTCKEIYMFGEFCSQFEQNLDSIYKQNGLLTWFEIFMVSLLSELSLLDKPK